MARIPDTVIASLAPRDRDTIEPLKDDPRWEGWQLAPGDPLTLQPTDPQQQPDPWSRWWATVRALRPDIIATRADTTVLIEVKPSLTPQALGQALLYREIARLQTDKPDKIHAAIIYQAGHPDIERIADALGIELIQSPGQ
jgi:hypothetical protein